MIIIASCVLVPVIVTVVGTAVIIVVVVVVFHIVVVAPWTEYQRARLKIEKLSTRVPLWRKTGVNNDKEGDLSQAQVATIDGQDVAGGGRDEGGVGAQEHGHANLTCGPQHIYFPLKIQIKKRTRTLVIKCNFFPHLTC